MPGSTLEDLEDEALVRRTLAGQADAFGVLVERYQARILAVCGQITGDFDQAPDLAQEAFINAYVHLQSYQMGRNFFAWLYRIAVNLSLTYRGRRRPPRAGWEEGEDAMLRAPDPGRSTEEQVESAELSRMVAARVSQLPPDYAAAIALRYGAGLEYEEIASTLNVPLGTVKARLFRAKAMLRIMLEPLRKENLP